MTASKTGYLGLSYGWWVVICIVYTLSPIDLVPAWVFGPLGLVDNVGVAAFGFYNFVRWTQARSAGPVATTEVRSEAPTRASVVDVSVVPAPPRMLSADPVPQLVASVSSNPVGVRRGSPVGPSDAVSEFEVQIVDSEDGTSRWVAVLADTAEQARAVVAAKGGDGGIGRVRLKRIRRDVDVEVVGGA
jgi:hypothetical protein